MSLSSSFSPLAAGPSSQMIANFSVCSCVNTWIYAIADLIDRPFPTVRNRLFHYCAHRAKEGVRENERAFHSFKAKREKLWRREIFERRGRKHAWVALGGLSAYTHVEKTEREKNLLLSFLISLSLSFSVKKLTEPSLFGLFIYLSTITPARTHTRPRNSPSGI